MKNKGFTLTELLIAIVVASITLLAITSLFSVGNRVVNQQVKPVSEAMEEAQSGLATLDFLMSRWGVGFPCTNCNVNKPLPDCHDYDTFPSKPNPSDYGNNPLCVTIEDKDNDGNSEVYFFASLGGSGFVISVDNNNNQANLISCRLSDSKENNCYYRFRNGNFLDFIQLKSLSSDNADCSRINLSQPNATASAYGLAEGDFIVRAPHFIKLYVKNGWLMMDKKDISPCNANENAVTIAKVKQFVAKKEKKEEKEKVGMGVKFEITFQSQTDPDKIFTVEKYYSR